MRFISNGDYLLPLYFPVYWMQHVYTWSFERGAANPDGIMRLPGRLIDILVFGLFGNIGLGYFYVISCLVIAFLAFLWFSRGFLEASRWGTAILGALFFALNPIFLGNISKVGLILAVSMLPVALTALKQGFAHKRFSFFLLFILALNVSLLHPFTFTINLIVSLGYAVFLVRKHRPFMIDNLWKFLLLGIVTLLLNAYFILPLASMRTLDKGALSDNVSSAPVDYTDLVDVANTGDIFTGLSLSKSVLKDYEFYGPMTWPFYFLGVFLFYALLFGVYVQVEKRLNPHERRRFLLAIGVFLALLVLATAGYMYADVLIKFLIGLPGGWMFRSPLKWQLYMPFALFAALVIALKYVQNGWRLKLLYAVFGLSFILMNGYLFKQVHERLLTPKTVSYFSELQQLDLQNKNLLFADSTTCTTIARDYPVLATEINQVLISKSVQVKHAQAGKLDTVNLGQYDYIFGCAKTLDEQLLSKHFEFEQQTTFVEGIYALYRNTQSPGYVDAVSEIFKLDNAKNLGGKYALTTSTLAQPFLFTTENNDAPATGIQDAFDILSAGNIQNGTMRGELKPIVAGDQALFARADNPLLYTRQGNNITFSPIASIAAKKASEEPILLQAPEDERLEITYSDPTFSYDNILPNPSLEQGLWQETVGDCNNYDDHASVFMKLQTKQATEGQNALELSAKKHIACTGPADVDIKPGAHYLLSFDYQTDGGRYAGYFAGFDDKAHSSQGARLDDTEGQWQSFSTHFRTPEEAAKLKLLVYAYPANTPGSTGIAHYDNFKLIEIPDIVNRFFLVSERSNTSSSAPRIEYKKSDPTRTIVQVRGALEPFYLTTKESYHDLWRISDNNGQTATHHIRLNGTMNGWYIDPKKWCASENACARQTDGSYDFTLTMEFTPQHWFYLGAAISGVTIIGVGIYVIYDIRRWRRDNGAGR